MTQYIPLHELWSPSTRTEIHTYGFANIAPNQWGYLIHECQSCKSWELIRFDGVRDIRDGSEDACLAFRVRSGRNGCRFVTVDCYRRRTTATEGPTEHGNDKP